MIVILLFNYHIGLYVVLSWYAAYSYSNAYVKRKPGPGCGFFRFQKHQMR